MLESTLKEIKQKRQVKNTVGIINTRLSIHDIGNDYNRKTCAMNKVQSEIERKIKSKKKKQLFGKANYSWTKPREKSSR